jgi:hypothetical protein
MARLFPHADAESGIFPMQRLNFATTGLSKRHIPNEDAVKSAFDSKISNRRTG